MNFVNLTPHCLNIVSDDGDVIRKFAPSGDIARCDTITIDNGDTVHGIPLVETGFGKVQGLPDPQADTVFIVSMVVGNALAGSRPDVIQPDTSPASAVRNDKGHIVGVKRFSTTFI